MYVTKFHSFSDPQRVSADDPLTKNVGSGAQTNCGKLISWKRAVHRANPTTNMDFGASSEAGVGLITVQGHFWPLSVYLESGWKDTQTTNGVKAFELNEWMNILLIIVTCSIQVTKVIEKHYIGNWNPAQSDLYVTVDIFSITLDICRQQNIYIINNDAYP